MSENVSDKKCLNTSDSLDSLDSFDNDDKMQETINEQKDILNFEYVENARKWKKCVCKLEIKNDILPSYASGFFCYIPSKERRVLITNNHVINEDFLNKKKELIIYIMDEGKEIQKTINLKSQRFKYTNEELDVTVIEIIDEDLIFNFIEVDEEILKNNEFLNEQVYNLHFPNGRQLKISFGNIIKSHSYKKSFIYNAGTKYGSSGSPIILTKENKIIGIHKGARHIGNDNKKENLGIYLNKIIESLPEAFNCENMNIVKCLYEIKNEDVNKDVKIYDNRNNIEESIKSVSIYKEYEEKEDIKNGTYRFKKNGKYLICFTLKDSLKNLEDMFYSCTYLKKVYMPSLFNNKIESMKNMFNGCINLEEINFPKAFNTSNVTNMSNLFYDCKSLDNLNISSFRTNKVKNMSNMFNKCWSLSKINVSTFNTEKVTSMRSMFGECMKLKEISLSSFKTESVIDLSNMFENCTSLQNLDLSSFNTINVNNMSNMFSSCISLKKINLSSFKVTDNTNIEDMFYGCTLLEKINCEDKKINKEFKQFKGEKSVN